MTKFEKVERPQHAGHGKRPSDLSVAVADTAESGGAIRFELNGKPVHTYRNQLFAYAKARGLSAHVIAVDATHFDAWMEKKA